MRQVRMVVIPAAALAGELEELGPEQARLFAIDRVAGEGFVTMRECAAPVASQGHVLVIGRDLTVAEKPYEAELEAARELAAVVAEANADAEATGENNRVA